MSQILDISLSTSIIILVLISAAFVIAGGLKAIAYTNVFQMLLLIGVSVLLVVMAVIKVGGISEIVHSTPVSYWKMFQPLSDPNFPWLAIVLGYPIMGVWFWCTDQSMVQSVLGAKNLKNGQLGANFVAWLKLIDIPLFILPGTLAFILIPQLSNSTDAYLKLVESVFPSGLIGLVIVVMMAALISTVGSALNSLSAVFTMDIFVKYYRPNADNKQIKLIGRTVVLAGAFLSIFLAIGITFIQGLSFFNIFQSVLGFIAPPMSVAFLFAVLWKKTSGKAINLTLSFGTLFSLGTGILYYNNLIFQGLHFLYISFIIFVVLAAFVLIYTLIDKQNVSVSTLNYQPLKIENKVKVAWAILIIVMIAMYVFFN